MTARSKPERTMHEIAATDHAYAEGFRRGVEAAADLVELYEPEAADKSWNTLVVLARKIRALRPEGEKT